MEGMIVIRFLDSLISSEKKFGGTADAGGWGRGEGGGRGGGYNRIMRDIILMRI